LNNAERSPKAANFILFKSQIVMLPIKQIKENNSKLSNSPRNSPGFAAVSSQFHIAHTPHPPSPLVVSVL